MLKDAKGMLTLEEIQKADIDKDFAREVLTQAEKRLADLIDAKKAVDTKATALFAAYVTLATATFGVGSTLLRNAVSADGAWPFFVAGSIFAFGAFVFVWTLRPTPFGYLGATPRMWLTKEWYSTSAADMAYMLAYTAAYYQDRIDMSDASNATRYRLFTLGMYVGLAGAATFAAALWLAASQV
jgi:hypothetical protein